MASIHSNAVVFEVEDGIYWLRGPDFLRATKVLRLACATGASGFDRQTAELHIGKLLESRVRVCLRRNGAVCVVQRTKPGKGPGFVSEEAVLPPEFFLDQRELERLSCHGRRSKTFAATLFHMRAALGSGLGLPLLFVYQVAAEMYEVDWELTSLTADSFTALALAASETDSLLACRVVPPKARRRDLDTRRRKSLMVSEPVVYGQLRLAF